MVTVAVHEVPERRPLERLDDLRIGATGEEGHGVILPRLGAQG
jgi:hypothetical protein